MGEGDGGKEAGCWVDGVAGGIRFVGWFGRLGSGVEVVGRLMVLAIASTIMAASPVADPFSNTRKDFIHFELILREPSIICSS